MTGYPTPETVVLGAALERQARERPGAIFAHFPGTGTSWTFADAYKAAQGAAMCYQSLGVGRGDRVLCWLPNGEDFLRVWFGTNLMGAIHTPCNLAWRGFMLENALQLSGARVAVVHADLLPRLGEIDRHQLQHVIVVGDFDGEIDGLQLHPATLLEQAGTPVLPDPPLQCWDDMQIIFTSGTTGPSKGALCSYAHFESFIIEAQPEGFGPGKTFMTIVPLFHAGGASAVYAQLLLGGTVVLPARFQSDIFWQTVRDYGVTATTLLGVMTPFLLSAPASADDRDHPLESASIAPLNSDALAFGERFGVLVRTSYGATEIGAIISAMGSAEALGSAGRLRPGYEARLVDEHDFDVAPGSVGELVVRANRPWCLFTNYYGNPAATVSALRNNWYHTGDLMRQADNGLYYFADRKKDAIRRRGENISSFEVEGSVLQCEGIREVAAYAVPSTLAEDEVMVAICLEESFSVDWTALVETLCKRMPHYMVPRFYRVLDELPRTENGKVRKEVLRSQGVTTDAWDREAAGIVLKGERVGQKSR